MIVSRGLRSVIGSLPLRSTVTGSPLYPFSTRSRFGTPDEYRPTHDTPAGRALEQIKARNYAEKYRALGQPMHLIGIEFSRQTRTVTGFEVEHA